VILKGYIIVSSDDLNTVKRELITHIALSKKENGCLLFEANQDTENPLKFNFYEEFLNREALSKHKHRVEMSTWLKVTINAERHFEIKDTD
jgi:quinol monooxygenase YgiN